MRKTLAERFWTKVQVGTPDECWLWIAAIDTTGYGVINEGGRGRKLYAHRVSYDLNVGPIPEGLELLHACDVRACVNPAHLSVGTRADNLQDASAKGRLVGRYSGMTHCTRGHEFTPENTRLRRRAGGGRSCRTCDRDRMRIRRAR